MHILPALLDICKFFKQQANGLIQKHQEMDKNSEALTQEILRKLLEIRTNNTIDMVHVKKTKKKTNKNRYIAYRKWTSYGLCNPQATCI